MIETLREAPHSSDAERAVLGSLMIDPGSLAQICDWLVEDDFYRRDHRLIFRAIKTLAEKSEPCDAVTLGEWFEAEGLTDDVGGMAYTLEIWNTTPSAANVVAYAEIVAEQSRKRQAIDIGTELAGGGFESRTKSGDVIGKAMHALSLMQATTMRGGLAPVSTALKSLFVEMSERYEQGPQLLGLPTPWHDLNEVTKGLRKATLYVIGARPSMGKALALDTPIPTPSGWTTMGDLNMGDLVLGMDGKPTAVSYATEVMLGRECYEVVFSDGAAIVADADHLWLTSTRSARRAATPPAGYEFRRESPYSRDQRGSSEVASVKTTAEILRTLRVGGGRLNHTVPTPQPLEFPDRELPIDPYILGYWLGDGSSYHANIYVGDVDRDALAENIKAAGYFHTLSRDPTAWRFCVSTQPIRRGGSPIGKDSLKKRLRDAGLIRNKHIPPGYLRASISQRKALMAGLLDSDGTVDKKTGRVCLAVTNRRLAHGFRELATSLGYKPNLTEKRVRGKSEESSTCYMVGFMAHDVPLRLARKAALLQARASRSAQRTIVDIRPVESVPVRCITVDNADHMYLAGTAMVPTHNTIAGSNIAAFTALRGQKVGFFSLEMGGKEIMARSVAALAGIPFDWVEQPSRESRSNDGMDDSEMYWGRLTRAMTDLINAPLLIDDTPSLTIDKLMARARREHMRSPFDLIVVDHIHDMAIDPKREARHEYGRIAQGGKTLAKEFDIPVVMLAQLNRSVTGRAEKRPTMADLRESGEIEQKADVILLMHREDYYDPNTHMKGVVELIPAKGRNIRIDGPIHLANRYDQMRLDDWDGPLPTPQQASEPPSFSRFKKRAANA